MVHRKAKIYGYGVKQLNKIYLSNLVNYNKVLVQRNKLLKELSFNMSDELLATLDIWDMQLVRFGSSIIDGRIKFVEELNDIISSIHSNLTGGKEVLVLSMNLIQQWKALRIWYSHQEIRT